MRFFSKSAHALISGNVSFKYRIVNAILRKRKEIIDGKQQIFNQY